jgi:glycosyltransferase involved in cell wall biosynthesis
MFSVIIPLYNKAKYIEKTIFSVLNQTYTDFELIIVDDGSTDNSLEVIKSFVDNRIQIITQRNNGVSSARNTGIINSAYEYIAFLDADDWWDTNFLTEISKMINLTDADMYATNYFFKYGDNMAKNHHVFKKSNQFVSEWYLCHLESIFCASSVVIKREIFKKIGMFDTRISYGEDIDLWIRIASNGNIIWSDLCLAVYNKTMDSLTTHQQPDLKKHLLSYLNKYDLTKLSVKYCVSLYQLKHGLRYYLFDGFSYDAYIARGHLWQFPLKFVIFYIIPIKMGRFLYKIYFKLK